MCLDRQTRVDEFSENGIGYKVFIKLDAISYASVFRSQIVIRDLIEKGILAEQKMGILSLLLTT